jgi:LacI family transcriptional regulator
MPKQPTLKDVAREAGVSVTTVSSVINNRVDGIIRVSEETREKVWQVANRLGYRPNLSARQMRTQKSYTIGFITDEIATTPFAGRIIRGAQYEAWKHGKLLFVINTDGEKSIEERAVSMLLERNVEGIIYATEYHRPVQPPLSIRETPVVLLDCFVEDRSLTSVVPDEVGGGLTATSALINRGHQRIGFIHHNKEIPATVGRRAGYIKALKEHGIPFDEHLVCVDEGVASGGYRSALALLERPDRPTAIFCWSDHMAMGAYDAIRKLGLRIPEDVAVVGFDNMEIIASQLHPPLTTIQLPYYEMGQWAVRQLVEGSVQKSDEQPTQHRMECTLIVRQST